MKTALVTGPTPLFELVAGTANGQTTPQGLEFSHTLWKRTQVVARPAIEIDPSIPQRVSEVVARCLEMEREGRGLHARGGEIWP